jgi:UDP-2,3-diacylglucosamine hydrolase
MRFDVPVVGPDTIKLLQEVKASCLAIEAKKTLIIDKEETIRLADEAGISIVAC